MKRKPDIDGNNQLRGLFARAILDENISIDIKVNSHYGQVTKVVLEASRHLFNTLQKKGASLEDIQEALIRKHHAAANYQKIFNTVWYF